ncbi:hypothetical protein [Moorena bouillonii]|uniref:hypothetical protein n=1 Tax=Moorena bouillonii TaxID=207920 RepID=UPI00117E4C1D|nr:hypothetical protein [Moorena bouillonii]NEO46170.1 hypothetical protein [Moorena sp. SIO4A3]
MQRGLGEAVRSWGGSAVLGRQRGLGGSHGAYKVRSRSVSKGESRCSAHSPSPLAIAVVSPMSDCRSPSNCRGFPHERLHQDNEMHPLYD